MKSFGLRFRQLSRTQCPSSSVASSAWRALGSLGVAALALGALACTSTQTVRYGRDGWRITCGDNMKSCAGRADTVCGDKGYTVVGGGTQSSMLGGTNGYQAKVRVSELIVRCGEANEEAGEETSQEPVQFKLPPRSDAAATAPAPASAPKQSCVPGQTQKCIGPGACEGGQACLADGSAYGACDCGGVPAPATPTDPGGWTSSAAPPQAQPAPATPASSAPAPSGPASTPAPSAPAPGAAAPSPAAAAAQPATRP
jgi:hypothetical protein